MTNSSYSIVRKPAYLAIMAADMVISMLISINDKNEAKKAADLEEEVYYRKQKLNFRYTMLNDNTSGFKLLTRSSKLRPIARSFMGR